MSVMNDMRYSSVYTPSTRIELRLVPSISNPCLWYRATARALAVCTMSSSRLTPAPGAHEMASLSMRDATPCDQ